jgi:hypothetical protein
MCDFLLPISIPSLLFYPPVRPLIAAMTVSYRTAITIVQFIFFVPSAVYAIWLCFHHGLKAAGTWRFIATLSLLRVAGSISYFVSLSNPGLHVMMSVVVCELSGLAPLMLVCVALVGRV